MWNHFHDGFYSDSMENGTNLVDNSTSSTKSEAGRMLGIVVGPILLVFGIVGNGFSVIVWTKKTMRTSTGLYLTVLAISDTVALLVGLLRQWLIYLLDLDIRNLSSVGCKLDIWLVYTCVDISAWMVTAVTMERAVCVCRPLHARVTCTKKCALVNSTVISLFLMTLNCHLLYGYVLKKNSNGQLICLEMNESYRYFIYNVWTWMDLCAYCLIPSASIIIGNTVIFYKLFQEGKNSLTKFSGQERSQNNGVCTVNGVKTEQQQHQGNTESAQNTSDTRHKLPGNKFSTLTAMLLTVNIMFLLTTLPVSIYLIGLVHWSENGDRQMSARLAFWWSVVVNLMYANHSVNFYLYCLSGSKFRRQLMALFKRNNSASLGRPWEPTTTSSTLSSVQCISGKFSSVSDVPVPPNVSTISRKETTAF